MSNIIAMNPVSSPQTIQWTQSELATSPCSICARYSVVRQQSELGVGEKMTRRKRHSEEEVETDETIPVALHPPLLELIKSNTLYPPEWNIPATVPPPYERSAELDAYIVASKKKIKAIDPFQGTLAFFLRHFFQAPILFYRVPDRGHSTITYFPFSEIPGCPTYKQDMQMLLLKWLEQHKANASAGPWGQQVPTSLEWDLLQYILVGLLYQGCTGVNYPWVALGHFCHALQTLLIGSGILPTEQEAYVQRVQFVMQGLKQKCTYPVSTTSRKRKQGGYLMAVSDSFFNILELCFTHCVGFAIWYRGGGDATQHDAHASYFINAYSRKEDYVDPNKYLGLGQWSTRLCPTTDFLEYIKTPTLKWQGSLYPVYMRKYPLFTNWETPLEFLEMIHTHEEYHKLPPAIFTAWKEECLLLYQAWKEPTPEDVASMIEFQLSGYNQEVKEVPFLQDSKVDFMQPITVATFPEDPFFTNLVKLCSFFREVSDKAKTLHDTLQKEHDLTQTRLFHKKSLPKETSNYIADKRQLASHMASVLDTLMEYYIMSQLVKAGRSTNTFSYQTQRYVTHYLVHQSASYYLGPFQWEQKAYDWMQYMCHFIGLDVETDGLALLRRHMVSAPYCFNKYIDEQLVCVPIHQAQEWSQFITF